MPLTYQVLRCFKCLVFQVHPTKRSRTAWACKLCDQKQSLKRFYSLGTAKECRVHVQTLNGLRGEIEDAKSTSSYNASNTDSLNIPKVEFQVSSNTQKNSKWEEFLDEGNEEYQQIYDQNKSLNTEVVSERPKKRLKKATNLKHSSRINNMTNRLSREKSANNDIDCKQPVTIIYKAKPNSEEVSLSKQGKKVKPKADADLSWTKFADEYNLNYQCFNNDDSSQFEPREWFSSIDDNDLDTILDL